MNLRRVFGLSVVAATASICLPALLSAQGADQPDVRIRLLDSGEIQVTGDFILEASPPAQQEVWVSGTSVFVERDRDAAARAGSNLLMFESESLERVSDALMRARDARIVRVR
jgi:hypothetical protein